MGRCLQNEQINSSMFKAEGKGEWGGEKTNVDMGREGGKRRSAAVGCYCHSVHPSLSACGSSSAAAKGVEVNWLELALS